MRCGVQAKEQRLPALTCLVCKGRESIPHPQAWLWGLGAGWELVQLKAAPSPCNAGWSSMWISVVEPWHRENANAQLMPRLSWAPALLIHSSTPIMSRLMVGGLNWSPPTALIPSRVAEWAQPCSFWQPLDVSPLERIHHRWCGLFLFVFLREKLVKEWKCCCVVFFFFGAGRAMLVFFPSSKQLSSYSAIPSCLQRRRNSWSGKKDGRGT